MQLQSCEIKQFSSTEENLTEKHNLKKYVKITDQVKEAFLKFIIQSNMSIKKASQALRINYSSAKAILSTHKKTIRISKTERQEKVETSHRSANLHMRSKLAVSCSVSGKLMEIDPIKKTKIIFKPEILVPVKGLIQ